jgi:hypothetical protein
MTFFSADVERVRGLLILAVPADVNHNEITIADARGVGGIGTYKRERRVDTVFVEGEVGAKIVIPPPRAPRL